MIIGMLYSALCAIQTMDMAPCIVMVLMGVAMVTGRLSALSYWLLEAFPAFSRIG